MTRPGNPLAAAATDGTGATTVLTNTTGAFAPSTGALAGSSAYAPFGEVTDRQGTGTALGYQADGGNGR